VSFRQVVKLHAVSVTFDVTRMSFVSALIAVMTQRQTVGAEVGVVFRPRRSAVNVRTVVRLETFGRFLPVESVLDQRHVDVDRHYVRHHKLMMWQMSYVIVSEL